MDLLPPCTPACSSDHAASLLSVPRAGVLPSALLLASELSLAFGPPLPGGVLARGEGISGSREGGRKEGARGGEERGEGNHFGVDVFRFVSFRFVCRDSVALLCELRDILQRRI